VLAFPAFYYLFILGANFMITPAVGGQSFIQRINPANKIMLISSIFFFYYLPFFSLYENKKKLLINILNFKEFLFTLLVFLPLIYFFSYEMSFTGGGIFFHISNVLFNNNIFLYLVSFFSILLVIKISKYDKINFFIFFLILINNPQLTIYHKYYDPLFWVLILFLMNIELNLEKIFNLKNILIFYIFSCSFLLISIFK